MDVIADLEKKLLELRHEHANDPTFGPRADVVQELFDLFKSNSFSARGAQLPIGKARENYSIMLVEKTFKELLKKPKEDESKKRTRDSVGGTGGSKPGGNNAKRHKGNDPSDPKDPSDSFGRNERNGFDFSEGGGLGGLEESLLYRADDDTAFENQSSTDWGGSDSESLATTDWDKLESDDTTIEEEDDKVVCSSVSSLSDLSYATAFEKESAMLARALKKKSRDEKEERQERQLRQTASYDELYMKESSIDRPAFRRQRSRFAAIYDSDEEDTSRAGKGAVARRSVTVPSEASKQEDISASDRSENDNRHATLKHYDSITGSCNKTLPNDFPLRITTLKWPSASPERVSSEVQHAHRRQVTNIQEDDHRDAETHATFYTTTSY